MSTVGGVSGSGLAMSLMYAMNDAAKEVRSAKREEATREANQALREGLAQADDLRKAGNEKFIGAVVGAGITAGSSGAQIGMLASAPSTPEMPQDLSGFTDVERSSMEGAQATARAVSQSRLAMASAAGSAGQLAGPVQMAFGAWADHTSANAAEHAARAQAASQRASVAESDAQEATAMDRKMKDLAQSVSELANSSQLAAILKG
jgi:hypothetical protein